MSLPEAVQQMPLDEAVAELPELIGDARVVAIGENNHQIGEFTALRHRIVRRLVTEMDFGVLACESGFVEGNLVDAWIRGCSAELDAVARDGLTFRGGDSEEMRAVLRWLRAHNAAGGRVRFAGLDLPASGGSAQPALRRVRAHLVEHAPDAVPLADAAIEVSAPYAAANNGLALGLYAELDDVQRNTATAALTRLVLRLDALVPGADRCAHRVARHHALAALRLDEQLREFAALFSRDSSSPAQRAVSSRDVYMAETARLLRELHGHDERIVLLLHNGHAQRAPLQLVPGVQVDPTGSYLADELDDDYVVLGLTARAGSTTEARVDETARHGIEVSERTLDLPEEGSLEGAVASEEPVLLDLRPARGEAGPTSLRHAHTTVPVDVLAAFDLFACLPEMSPSTLAAAEDCGERAAERDRGGPGCADPGGEREQA
ncbi:erythromycin esterase family protein [Bounagaea algeriensis]